MSFVIAAISIKFGLGDWPSWLIYGIEGAAVVLAFVCSFLVAHFDSLDLKSKADGAGTIAAFAGSIAILMPFELAPFFFGVRGEIMLATIALNLFYIPLAIVLYKAFR